jgi:hypothetical protein
MFKHIFIWMAFAISPYSAAAASPGFDFTTGNPIQFLQFLKENKGEGVYTVTEPVVNWIKLHDVPALVAMLNSEEECMAVVSARSSHLRLRSTIGDEAAFLLEGFHAGRYPSRLNSKSLGKDEKARILARWQRFLSEHRDTGRAKPP